jgi:hypothetical protein
MFGPVSIMGDLVPGNSLIGRTNGAVPFSKLKRGSETYEWYSDGVLVGTSKVYVVKPTDILKSLTFKYHFSTSDGYHTIESKPELVDLGYWRNLYWKHLDREPDKEGLEWWENRIEQYFKESIK